MLKLRHTIMSNAKNMPYYSTYMRSEIYEELRWNRGDLDQTTYHNTQVN